MKSIKKFMAKFAVLNKSHFSILTFHSIGNKYSFSVKEELFLNFVDLLINHGEIVPLDFYNHLTCKNKLTQSFDRYFSITFDDGHKDNLFIAHKLIEKKIPFTLFINASLFNDDRLFCIEDISSSRETTFVNSDFVTLEEAKEISYSPYAIIAPHGYRHTRLSTLTNSQLEIDIKKTIHIFTENNFNRDFFAIPFGRIGYDFSMRDILLIKKYGLKPLSMSPIAITHSERQLVIPRIGLGIGDQHLWLEKACGAGRLWKFFKEPRLK